MGDAHMEDMTMLRTATILMMLHILAGPLQAADNVGGYVYLRIFGAVTVLPTECAFDVSTIAHGASFVCERGRVIVGDYRELGPDFHQYVQGHLIGKVERCGVSMVTFGKDNAHSVLVYDKNEFLISTVSPEILELFMMVLCTSRTAE
jgi:hypothetical protein